MPSMNPVIHTAHPSGSPSWAPLSFLVYYHPLLKCLSCVCIPGLTPTPPFLACMRGSYRAFCHCFSVCFHCAGDWMPVSHFWVCILLTTSALPFLKLHKWPCLVTFPKCPQVESLFCVLTFSALLSSSSVRSLFSFVCSGDGAQGLPHVC